MEQATGSNRKSNIQECYGVCFSEHIKQLRRSDILWDTRGKKRGKKSLLDDEARADGWIDGSRWIPSILPPS